MKLGTLKISTKMLALLLGLCLCITLIGIIGLYGMHVEKEGLDAVYQNRVTPLKQIKLVSDAYAVQIVDTAHKVRDGNLSAQQGAESITQAKQTIQEQWAAYLATYLVGEEKELVQAFENIRQRADIATTKLLQLMQTNNIPGLRDFAANEMYAALDPLQHILGKLIELQLSETQQQYQASHTSYQYNLVIILSLIGLCLTGATISGYYITTSITGALGTEPAIAAEMAKHVAAGDLTTPIELKHNDQSSLMAQLRSMQNSLITVVDQVYQSAHGVAAASAQIAQGNIDLSSRTEEQASALEETASSMEELTTTIQQNSDSANQANVLANDAANIAKSGREAMQQLIATMQDIDESSRQIASIISVIDGIAFQTNILALNAAVEAARAGEQGRGFAVVASEVRNLAGRSAEAAKQIKSLIDGSVIRVKKGSEQMTEAGATMSKIDQAIQRVTSLVSEISTASSEQAQGANQVSQAVSQMDEVTQQNAALVEEIAATASSMNDKAQDLVKTVTHFKLPSSTHRTDLQQLVGA